VISKTDAVVLHTRKFRESSKIVTLYTRDHGKIAVIARGVERPKSKFGSVLQPMACISTMIYMKEGRDLQNLSDAEAIARFNGITSSLERMSAGLSIIELVNATVHESDPSPHLFDALIEALRTLNSQEQGEDLVHLWFIIRLATELGYAIRTDECGVCEEPVASGGETVAYSIATGAPLCSEHRESASYRPIGPATLGLLRTLLRAGGEEAAGLGADTGSITELRDALTAFVRYHVEGLRRLNVGNVSVKILAPVQ
jgi:DNA repair protein RecO (recombination protein O)